MSRKHYRHRLLVLVLAGVLCTAVPMNGLAASNMQQSEQDSTYCLLEDLLNQITEDSLENIEEIETSQETEGDSGSVPETEQSESDCTASEEQEESSESVQETEESSETASQTEESSTAISETEESESAKTEQAEESSQESSQAPLETETVEVSSEAEELTEGWETESGILSETVRGKQGSNISWALTPEGVLTITGNGRIYPYYENYEMQSRVYYGWDCYAPYIKRIAVGEGITEIPEYAFYYMSELKVVLLSDTVKKIKAAAFADNPKLCAVYFMGDAPNLGRAVFDGCLEELTLYYLDGKKGWDQVDAYQVAVWKNAAAISAEEEADKKKPYEKKGQKGDSADTGDRKDVYGYTLMMLASAAGAGFVWADRKKRLRNLENRPQMKGKQDEIS